MSKSDDIQTAPVLEKTAEINEAPRPGSASEGSQDPEKGKHQAPGLHRQLKARHLQMIAIGMSDPLQTYYSLT